LLATQPKRTIPQYSLEQTSENGNNLFEIREYSGARAQHRTKLFLPHRKDYYFFFLVKSGYNQHWIDFVHYEARPGHLYFTLPHQVHLKERNTPVDGILLAFTEEFLITEEQKAWKKLPILQNPDDRHEMEMSEPEIAFLDHLFTQMLAEYAQPEDWQKSMLQSYLRVFLVYISRIYTRQFKANPVTFDSQSLVKRMKKLVNEKYNALHQVSDYAQLLNVTPGHLNDTIREQTGKTATTLIQERIILEAKRALFHGDLSVKEIGYALGFDDPAYFSRFFKRLTGETPLSFRTDIREKYH
jgi:AraC family transcriptional regulator, transcriptional activator of pobA